MSNRRKNRILLLNIHMEEGPNFIWLHFELWTKDIIFDILLKKISHLYVSFITWIKLHTTTCDHLPSWQCIRLIKFIILGISSTKTWSSSFIHTTLLDMLEKYTERVNLDVLGERTLYYQWNWWKLNLPNMMICYIIIIQLFYLWGINITACSNDYT